MKNVLQYILFHLSRAILTKYKPVVIGITGSVGKTATKEAIAQLLGSTYRIRKSEKNYNTELGVPISILGCDSPGKSLFGWLGVIGKALGYLLVFDKQFPELLILEMGADKPGDIAYLTKMAPCHIGVLTAVGNAHLEYFKTQKAILDEKKIILTHLTKKDFAVVNADDALITSITKEVKAKIMSFGTAASSDVRITNVKEHYHFTSSHPGGYGLSGRLSYKKNTIDVDLPDILGKQNLYAIAAAMAVAAIQNVSFEQIAKALDNFQPQKGRMSPLAGIKQSLIIDDSYNSSPIGCLAALDALAKFEIDERARTIAVLGDMLELGPDHEAGHRQVGEYAATRGIDMLVAVGKGGKIMIDAATQKGFDKKALLWFDSSVKAGKELQKLIKKGDVVLVKGSQGMRMEKVVKEVMATPERAEELLVRQDNGWE